MIKDVDGDLLKYPLDTLIHVANCQVGVFGSGLALAIKNKYPEAYEADLAFSLNQSERLGTFSWATTYDSKTIINCYGQFNIGRGKQISYDAIDQSFGEIADFLGEDMDQKIGIPAGFGSVRGGGNWIVIKALIEAHFSDFENFYIVNKDFYVK